MSATATITYTDLHFTIKREYDQDPDLSWLEQTDAEMGDGFEQASKERIDAYNNGDWCMVGVIVNAWGTGPDGRVQGIAQESIWGIESDSGNDYFSTIESDLMLECRSFLRSRYELTDDAMDAMPVTQ